MKSMTASLLLLGVLTTGFVGWREHISKTQKINHAELVVDRSVSNTNDCSTLIGVAQRAIHMDVLSAGSVLTIVVVGDEKTAHEPWRLATYDIPKTTRAIENPKTHLRKEYMLLEDLRNKCINVRATTISPIFIGVKQAIADLHARGCGSNSQCQLFAITDGEENVESSVKHSISGTSNMNQSLSASLNNEGIHVTFCGLAALAGRIVDPAGREIRKVQPHDSNRDDRLRKTWSALFTTPANVTFEPYCPQTTELEGESTTSKTKSEVSSQIANTNQR